MCADLRLIKVAVILALITLCGEAAQAALDFTSGACKPRDAVSAAIRQPYEKVALDFVSEIVHGDIPQAYSQMRQELQNSVPVDRFAEAIKPNAAAFNSLGPLTVSRSYLVEVGATAGNGQKIIVCQADLKTPMPMAEGRVYLVTDQTPTEAYVLVEGTGTSGPWTFTLWMVRLQNVWLVSHLHVAAPFDWDKTPDEIFNLATDENRKGHALSAYLLYSAVIATAYRGEKFSLGIRSDSEAKMKELTLPPEFQGKAPYILRLGKSTYSILSLKIVSDERRLALELTYKSDANSGATQNNALIRDLRATHPEYLAGFESVIAIAVDPSGNRVRSAEIVR